MALAGVGQMSTRNTPVEKTPVLMNGTWIEKVVIEMNELLVPTVRENGNAGEAEAEIVTAGAEAAKSGDANGGEETVRTVLIVPRGQIEQSDPIDRRELKGQIVLTGGIVQTTYLQSLVNVRSGAAVEAASASASEAVAGVANTNEETGVLTATVQIGLPKELSLNQLTRMGTEITTGPTTTLLERATLGVVAITAKANRLMPSWIGVERSTTKPALPAVKTCVITLLNWAFR